MENDKLRELEEQIAALEQKKIELEKELAKPASLKDLKELEKKFIKGSEEPPKQIVEHYTNYTSGGLAYTPLDAVYDTFDRISPGSTLRNAIQIGR